MIELTALEQTMSELGQPLYRARQVYEALTRELMTSFADMTTLPKSLRSALADRLQTVSLKPTETLSDPVGRVAKTLFSAIDGQPVEAVLMTYPRRASVCVSTQVGCAVGCAFCASGRLGLRRNLTAEEMADQVLHFARELRISDAHVTNVVFMGMGEPFHNYDEVLRACHLLNDASGFALAARGISVSTAGVVPGINRFAAEPLQLNLAVSLHAATDELRSRLVPLNRTYPLASLMAACADYVRRTRRKLFFEYVVLPGVNDTGEQLAALAKLLRPPLYHLNLIGYNPAGGEFRHSTGSDLATLRERLTRAGLAVTVRRSPGEGIAAACGQLALRRTQRTSS
ncbi:MAG: 23S rRNA (adenine(2503)-C(2))-methyltransferase RlmN [Thermoleophilia bacterium]